MSVFSSVIHESGHLMLMKLLGDRINYIELSLFGMRIEKCGALLSYKKEAIIAMGGIVLNFVFFLWGIGLYLFIKKEDFLFFSFVNGFIALVNMIPVRILDFGRFIYCFLCERYEQEKSERVTDIISAICCAALSVACVLYCIFININISLIAVTLYLNIIIFKKKWS